MKYILCFNVTLQHDLKEFINEKIYLFYFYFIILFSKYKNIITLHITRIVRKKINELKIMTNNFHYF